MLRPFCLFGKIHLPCSGHEGAMGRGRGRGERGVRGGDQNDPSTPCCFSVRTQFQTFLGAQNNPSTPC